MHKSNRSGFFLKLGVLIVFFVLNSIFAADKGKIAGVITDAETGEPLVGVNVIIDGTLLGTSTDLEGYYFIINIPPGVYTVKAMMVGNATVVKKNVEVSIGQTTKLNFEMKPEAIKGEEIVIVAKRPVVQLDVSSSQHVLDVSSIQSRPVSNFEELLSTEAGIQLTAGRDGGGLVIRGGNVNETDIVVDGLSTRNERNQQPITNLSLTAIDEVQILTGGFTAEYGDIRSGMVTVATKEGSSDRYSINADLRLSPAARKHFGPSPYGIDGPFWPIYTGKDAFSGVTDEMVQKGEYAYPFVGWNQVARDFASDGDTTNDYTAQELLDIWKWHHRPQEYAQDPDYIADVTLSGPIPGTPITFMVSERYENLQLAYPFSMKNSEASTTLLKFTTYITPSIKVSFNNMYSYQTGVRGTVYGNSTGMITGTREGTGFAQSALSEPWLFHDSEYNPITNRQYRGGLMLNHVLDNKTYYDVRIEYTNFRTKQAPGRLRDTTKIKKIGDRWYDETPFGYIGPENGHGYTEHTDILNQFYMSGGGRGRDFSKYWGVSFAADLVSQFNKHHQFKAGLSMDYTDFTERRDVYSGGGLPGTWETKPYNFVYYDNSPLKLGAYIQDKMEYAGMIANVGLRLDYLNAMTPPYNLDPSFIFAEHPYTLKNFKDDGYSFSQFTTDEKAYRLYLSPRLGISHPVTESSKIFFNYGHFYQPPIATRLYSLRTTETGSEATIPNIRANWPLTISYEVGFEQSIAKDYLIHVMGYYKDVSEQLSTKEIIAFESRHVVNTWGNNSYADIRGLEVKLEKRVGRWWYGFITMNYRIKSTGRSGLARIYEDPLLADKERESAGQQRGWPGFSVWGNLTFKTPDDWAPWAGTSAIFGGWRLNVLQNWSDGGKMLINPGATLKELHYADVIDYWNTDILLEKRFRVGSLRLSAYMQVYNLFNYKGMVNPWNWDKYIASLHFPWESGDQKGNDKVGQSDKKYMDIGYNTYSHFINPRDIFFGIKIQF